MSHIKFTKAQQREFYKDALFKKDEVNEFTGNELPRILKRDEVIDLVFGGQTILITDEFIDALNNGKAIYFNDGEYFTLLMKDGIDPYDIDDEEDIDNA